MEIIREQMALNDDYFICFPLIQSDDRPNRLSGVVAADIDEIKLYVVDINGSAAYTIDQSTQFHSIGNGWYYLVIPGGSINKVVGTNHIITIKHDGTENFDTQTVIVRFVENFGGVDCNVVSVDGNAVTSVDDFKANVSGLSTFDHENDTVKSDIQSVKTVSVTSVDDFKADVSGLSTFDHENDTVKSDIQSVKAVSVTSVDDFKADTNGISCNSNVISVDGNPVTSADDFKADVSGLSTFDHENDTVKSDIQSVKTVSVASVDDFKGSFNLDELVDGVTLRYIFELMAAMANGDYDIETISDVLERVTLYKRNGSTILSRFEISPAARRRLL